MPPVSKDVVLKAVDTYGIAWTTQDPDQLSDLFTSDAVYVERAFDKKATFRGLVEIQNYWRYQVCGKQSNVRFRHMASADIRDADQPIAVVQWLAEFDNRREQRGPEKTHKRVRFIQMAKLVFDEKEPTKISYLEEYAQAMTGPGVKWPGIDASETELQRCLRFDPLPPEPPKPTSSHQCTICSATFTSRTKLFEHLRSTMEDESGTSCLPNPDMEVPIVVCFSLMYLACSDPSTLLTNALEQYVRVHSKTTNFDSSGSENLPEATQGTNPSPHSIMWAAPPSISACAVVNVAVVKLRPSLFPQQSIDDGSLQQVLNAALLSATSTMTIHSIGVASRTLVPERRDMEKYICFLPWSLLQNSSVKTSATVISDDDDSSKKTRDCPTETVPDPITPAIASACPSQQEKKRHALESTSAFQFVTPDLAQRVKRGARILSDQGSVGRIRTGVMEEPWHAWCRIQVTMKPVSKKDIQNVLSALVNFVRGNCSEEELAATTTDATKGQTRKDHNVFVIPVESICLLEPCLSPFETKNHLGLCRHGLYSSQALKESVDAAEATILKHIMACVER